MDTHQDAPGRIHKRVAVPRVATLGKEGARSPRYGALVQEHVLAGPAFKSPNKQRGGHGFLCEADSSRTGMSPKSPAVQSSSRSGNSTRTPGSSPSVNTRPVKSFPVVLGQRRGLRARRQRSGLETGSASGSKPGGSQSSFEPVPFSGACDARGPASRKGHQNALRVQLMQASSPAGRCKVNPYKLSYACGKASRTLARFIQIDDSDPDPAML